MSRRKTDAYLYITILTSPAEAGDYVKLYQKPIENAVGKICIKLWERTERDDTTLAKGTTSQGETTTEVSEDLLRLQAKRPGCWSNRDFDRYVS